MSDEDALLFNLLWKQRFGSLLPISHDFKWTHHDRWMRIHSLPDSKRYPDTDSEYQQISSRQNTVFSDLIPFASPYYLIYMRYDHDLSNKYYDEIECFTKFRQLKSFRIPDDESTTGKLYADIADWSPYLIDNILYAIADDKIRVIFMPVTLDRLIIPYDGGMDLIFESISMKERFLIKYQHWTFSRSEFL